MKTITVPRNPNLWSIASLVLGVKASGPELSSYAQTLARWFASSWECERVGDGYLPREGVLIDVPLPGELLLADGWG